MSSPPRTRGRTSPTNATNSEVASNQKKVYNSERLENLCQKSLQVTLWNYDHVIMLGHAFLMTSLIEMSKTFVKDNFKEVIEMRSWVELMTLQPQIALDFLRCLQLERPASYYYSAL